MRGKGAKLSEGEGTKLGEYCSKVRLSQDRMPIEQLGNSGFLHLGFSPFLGFGIFTFGIVLFGKSAWRRYK